MTLIKEMELIYIQMGRDMKVSIPKALEADRVFSIMQMDLYMRDNGKRIKNVARAKNIFQMEAHTLENGKMTKEMVMEQSISTIKSLLKEFGKMIKYQREKFKLRNIKVNFHIPTEMDREFTSIRTEAFTVDNFITVKNRGMAFIIIRMEMSMKDNSKKD